jgi:Undecaprenyl-phosphate galactose phosphotransferase WbaP
MLAVMFSFGWGFFCVKMYSWSIINSKSFITYWPYLPVFIIFFIIFGLYPGVSLAPSEELRRFSIGSAMAYGGIIMSRYIENNNWDSITVAFTVSCIFSSVIMLTERTIAHWLLRKTRLGGIPSVIYGSGSTGKLVVDCLLGSSRTGYFPVLILDSGESGIDEYKGVPVIHDIFIGQQIVKNYNIKMAVLAMPELDAVQLKHLINNSVSAFRYNVLIPNFFTMTNIWMAVRDFDGVLGLDTSNKLKVTWNRGIKRFMDLTIVIIGGLIVLPFLLLIAFLIKFSSSGKILYKHKRLGINGRYFYAYKFRSMVNNSDEFLIKVLETDADMKKEWEMNHKLQNDPRITKIGKILRRYSLDEFPQLINILKGEMSLVGPRPIVDDEIQKYGEEFKRIFAIKPGLTGLWQISGRNDTNYNDRVTYDTYYLQSWSPWLDLWIIYKTFSVVFTGKGAY